MAEEIYRDALPLGAQVGGYIINKVLGQGGFGITYAASSAAGVVERKVAIKEFFPNGLAYREGGSVALSSRIDKVAYDAALKRFEAEARKLVDVYDHPHVVRGENVVHAHGSVFLVMEFIDGEMLHDWVLRHGGLGEAELRALMAPVFDAVEYLHNHSAMHRDLSPKNIMIRMSKRGRDVVEPVLIDFGAIGDGLDLIHDSTIAVANPGYAPPEQQEPTGAMQGRYTDIFALGGCVYFCATGKGPVKPMTRLAASAHGNRDPLVPAAEIVADRRQYGAAFFTGLDQALRLDAKTRPQTVTAFRQALGWVPSASAQASSDAPTMLMAPPTAVVAKPQRSNRGALLVGAALGVIALGGAGAVYGPKMLALLEAVPVPAACNAGALDVATAEKTLAIFVDACKGSTTAEILKMAETRLAEDKRKAAIVVAALPPKAIPQPTALPPKVIVVAPDVQAKSEPTAKPEAIAAPQSGAEPAKPKAENPPELQPKPEAQTKPEVAAAEPKTDAPTVQPKAVAAPEPAKVEPMPSPEVRIEPATLPPKSVAVEETAKPVAPEITTAPKQEEVKVAALPDPTVPPPAPLSVQQMAQRFKALSASGGLILEPRSAPEFYHNARQSEGRGDALAARKFYSSLAQLDIDAVDAWARFATVLRVQDGLAGAREVFAGFAPKPRSAAFELVSATLYGEVERRRRIESFVKEHPDYGPGWFHLADEYSEARLGSQTLTEKRKESEALAKFLEADDQGDLVRHFMDPVMLGDWLEQARRRKTAIDAVLKNTQSIPAATFTRSNADWSVYVQLPEAALGFSYRLGDSGEFKTTGPGQGIDPRTGKPLPSTLISVVPGREPKEIQVRYLDLRGSEIGPFTIAFDPLAALLGQIKQTLEITKGSWVAFGGYNAPLLYTSHLIGYRCGIDKATYGLDGAAPDKPLPMPPCDAKNPYAIPSDFNPYFKIPATTKSATVRLTFKDGSMSETTIPKP